MSDFHNKQFEGRLYTFEHLAPLTLEVHLKVEGKPVSLPVHVTFGCHCFTEEFKQAHHQTHHRYQYRKELRAFNVERYHCSLQLPQIVQGMSKGTIYRSDQSYTYVAQIQIPTVAGQTSYSVFFSLTKSSKRVQPALELYVKSAYPSALKSTKNAQNWRFAALAGEVAGLF